MKPFNDYALAMTCAAVLLAGLVSGLAQSDDIERLERRRFGATPEGRAVQAFTLRNVHGMEVELIEYGATVTRLLVPDRNGRLKNVVAGADSMERYLKGFPAASVIGRFANRIDDASFELDGVERQVTRNAGPNHIHGGRKGFAKVVWSGAPVATAGADAASVEFRYRSADGEEGFPGALVVRVVYTLNDRNELRLEYEAVAEKATPVNLTNHAYIHLGNEGGYGGHRLRLNAAFYTPVDSELIPTGEIASVEGTVLDFREARRLDARQGDLQPRPGVYDHNYVLDKYDGALGECARVWEPQSGRMMIVSTTEPGVQLYTGNPAGFCLETQHFPDSPNHPHFPSTIVRPGEPFRSVTVFGFETRD